MLSGYRPFPDGFVATVVRDGQLERVAPAFRGAETEEEFQAYQSMFHDYVRGGVEELYERLIIQKAEPDSEFYDNKTANLMSVLERFGYGLQDMEE